MLGVIQTRHNYDAGVEGGGALLQVIASTTLHKLCSQYNNTAIVSSKLTVHASNIEDQKQFLQ